MQYSELRSRILKRIRPSKQEEEKIHAITESFLTELRIASALAGVEPEFVLGGSAAKGTALKNNHDIDIFARFSKERNISDELERILKLVSLPYERVHGSRDYFQLQNGTFTIEVVPVRKISGFKDARNVTDMSPLHVKYAKKKLSPKLCDDVRMLKQFCKAQRIYGAESYINGFSGHVLELLVIHHGGLLPLFRAVKKWGSRTVIDQEKHHRDPEAVLNESKKQSPLIVIDPVQPDRNAAAAISRSSYEKLIRVVNKKLTLSSFTYRELTPQYKKNRLVLELVAFDGKKDVVGTKCLKAFEFLLRELHEFGVKNYDFEYNHEYGSALAYIDFERVRLPVTYLREGPPLRAKKAVVAFKKKHRSAFAKDGRLYVRLRRKITGLRAFAKNLCTGSYVRSRVEKVY